MSARLLTLAAVAAAALCVGVAGAAGGIAVTAYQWQQPTTAPVVTPHAQPVLRQTEAVTYASSGYVWVQPGTAVPHGLAGSPR